MIEQLRAFDTSDLVKKRLPPVMSAPASTPGMLTGVVFAALTNFPSMIPKNGLVQGVVLGITFAIGYGFGAALHWLWRFLELPSPQGRVWRSLAWIWYLLLPALLLFSAWHYVGWQNTARAAFGMETISPLVWLVVVPVAAAVTLLVFIVARSLRKLFNLIVHWFDQHLPRRLALLVGGVAFFGMMWGLWSGVMVDAFLLLPTRYSHRSTLQQTTGSFSLNLPTDRAARRRRSTGRHWDGRGATSLPPDPQSRI